MKNNKHEATTFIDQYVDETGNIPDDTGKLSDMLVAYGDKINIIEDLELLIKLNEDDFDRGHGKYILYQFLELLKS
jgi:hypothetical protein